MFTPGWFKLQFRAVAAAADPSAVQDVVPSQLGFVLALYNISIFLPLPIACLLECSEFWVGVGVVTP